MIFITAIFTLLVYFVVAAIFYTIGFWFFCKSYNNYRCKHKISFNEYFDDNGGWFAVPAICWPLVIILSPLILLFFGCYIIMQKIKKHFNIVN